MRTSGEVGAGGGRVGSGGGSVGIGVDIGVGEQSASPEQVEEQLQPLQEPKKSAIQHSVMHLVSLQ